MKRALAILLALCLLLGSAAMAETSWESAQDALKGMRIGWNLGNTLDSNGAWIAKQGGTPRHYETAWGNPATTPEIIQAVKDAGFGAVRVPVTFREHLDESGIIQPAWLSRMEEIVNYVLDAGMYCILNVHHDTGAEGWLRASSANFEQNSERYAGIWKQVSERFADYGEKLLFEGFNEMLDEKSEWNNPSADSLDAINRYNQLFVDTVRASGGNNARRNLVLTTYAAGSSQHLLDAFVVPTDTAEGHLIAEVHSYEPWGFNSADVDWTPMTDQWNDGFTQMLKAQYDRLGKASAEKGIPVIMGEFGNQDKKNPDQYTQFASLSIRFAKENGVVCFYWDDGGNFILLNRRTREWLRPDFVQAMMAELE